MSVMEEQTSGDFAGNGLNGLFQQYKIPIILGVVSILIIAVSAVLLVKSTQVSIPIQFTHENTIGGGSSNILGSSNRASQSANISLITVDIEGAVVHPGVMSMSSGARVEDAIKAAGGLRSDADNNYVAKTINRAMKLGDGMKIYIPTGSETSHNGDSCGRLCEETSHNLSTSQIGELQNGGGVSVNMASKDALDSLAGVGPVTAQKIIDNRPYETLEDLVGKKAMGPALFEKLKSQLSL